MECSCESKSPYDITVSIIKGLTCNDMNINCLEHPGKKLPQRSYGLPLTKPCIISIRNVGRMYARQSVF